MPCSPACTVHQWHRYAQAVLLLGLAERSRHNPHDRPFNSHKMGPSRKSAGSGRLRTGVTHLLLSLGRAHGPRKYRREGGAGLRQTGRHDMSPCCGFRRRNRTTSSQLRVAKPYAQITSEATSGLCRQTGAWAISNCAALGHPTSRSCLRGALTCGRFGKWWAAAGESRRSVRKIAKTSSSARQCFCLAPSRRLRHR